MKVFFIFAESQQKNKNVATLISAFAHIKSIGRTDDMIDAIRAIQKRYPEATVSKGSFFDCKSELISRALDGTGGPLVILMGVDRAKETSLYIGVEFSPDDFSHFRWTIRSILTIIEEYHGKTADSGKDRADATKESRGGNNALST